jgi:quercetin dioxygenase-like cupin family protein
LIFALFELAGGVETDLPTCVVYDLERGEANFGPAQVDGAALVWTLDNGRALATGCDRGVSPAIAKGVKLDAGHGWVVRCDRVDFPPGGVAYRHVHPGPGIRRLLHGELTIEREDGNHTYRAGQAWFEDAEDAVLATASATEETAFVRVLLLPSDWAGKRTIRYLDPADEERPKLQRATVLLEEPFAP